MLREKYSGSRFIKVICLTYYSVRTRFGEIIFGDRMSYYRFEELDLKSPGKVHHRPIER